MSTSLESPRFRLESLNPRLAVGDEGDAFQRFAAEILVSEFPGLHAFPGRGKDGCIDLICPADRPDTAFECKAIGADGLEAAEARWREVAGKFSRNLAAPSGPPAGEPQYGPWYRSDIPIRRYAFCVSSRLRNERERQVLLDRIHVFFEDLSARHGHLRHLAGLQVLLRDWGDFGELLASRPHLLFRWFPRARPHGLLPLGEEPAGSRFSEYLTSARLPYYSRREHLDRHPAPPGTLIPDEAGLLASFESERVNGLVITGGGGFGKTRLMLELGHRAQETGWAVFRLQGRLRSDSLEQLADHLRPSTPALLLVDYVETQPAYEEVMETLNLLVEERQIPLRYIACCRSSFYPAIQLIGSHRRVDLFPQEDTAGGAWLDGFRQSTVRHIVEESGVPSPARVVEMSRATPVLAVFAAWLHDRGRGSDLHELLGEPDFGTWVHKRVRQSFPDSSAAAKLGSLVALFPLPDQEVGGLDDIKSGLLDRLALDGWVERVEEPTPRWEAAHDVLADQVLSSYLSTVPATSRRFVQELFQEAARLSCIDSALTALQRVGSHRALADLDWVELISESMVRDPAAWRSTRLATLRSPLMTVHQRIQLLGKAEEAWRQAEREVAFQKTLGWFIRAVAASEEVDEAIRNILKERLKHAVPWVKLSNYLLTQGLRLDPEIVRNTAHRWLLNHSTTFRTHYLLRGWLLARLPAGEVEDVVRRWLARHQQSLDASFVLSSWLKAGGDRALVRENIVNWLSVHGALPEARFVLDSWLDAGGDRELLRSHVVAWLSTHSGLPEARFVLDSWLAAGGEREPVRSSVVEWLAAHGAEHDACFVLRAWLVAGGERDLVQSHVAEWLLVQGTLPEAQFVLKSWLDAGGEKDLVRSSVVKWLSAHGALPEARFVLQSWLNAEGEKDLVRTHMVAWLSAYGTEQGTDFVIRAWLKTKGEFESVRDAAAQWLRVHRKSPEAAYITKVLTEQSHLPLDIVRDVLSWCHTFRGHEDALSRISALRRHLLLPELANEVAATCETVVAAALSSSPGPERRALIAIVFSWLGENQELSRRLAPLFSRWLRDPASFSFMGIEGRATILAAKAEKPSLLRYLQDLIDEGALSLDRDRDALRRFSEWVIRWSPDKGDRTRTFLVTLAEAPKPEANPIPDQPEPQLPGEP